MRRPSDSQPPVASDGNSELGTGTAQSAAQLKKTTSGGSPLARLVNSFRLRRTASPAEAQLAAEIDSTTDGQSDGTGHHAAVRPGPSEDTASQVPPSEPLSSLAPEDSAVSTVSSSAVPSHRSLRQKFEESEDDAQTEATVRVGHPADEGAHEEHSCVSEASTQTSVSMRGRRSPTDSKYDVLCHTLAVLSVLRHRIVTSSLLGLAVAYSATCSA